LCGVAASVDPSYSTSSVSEAGLLKILELCLICRYKRDQIPLAQELDVAALVSDALKAGFAKMLDSACDAASERMTNKTLLSKQEKQGVKGLLCESMTFVAELVVNRDASVTDVGIHLITNGVSLGKLSNQQQAYCIALKAELAVNTGKLAALAAATYTGAVAGGHGGVIAGGITGTVLAGPAGTVPGVAIGGIAGAAGPLLLGGYKMYEAAATLTNLAIDVHSQCGPLSLAKATPTRLPTLKPATLR
jgi:hypothetical protein